MSVLDIISTTQVEGEIGPAPTGVASGLLHDLDCDCVDNDCSIETYCD